MEISKRSIERMEKYITKLVKAQPRWLRNLFDEERVMFVMEDNGMLQLAVDEKLDDSVKEKAKHFIHTYITHHPTKVLSSRDIFH